MSVSRFVLPCLVHAKNETADPFPFRPPPRTHLALHCKDLLPVVRAVADVDEVPVVGMRWGGVGWERGGRGRGGEVGKRRSTSTKCRSEMKTHRTSGG